VDVEKVLKTLKEKSFNHEVEDPFQACNVSGEWGEEDEVDFARIVRLSLMTLWRMIDEGICDECKRNTWIGRVLSLVWMLVFASMEWKISKVVELLESGLYKLWEEGFDKELMEDILYEIADLAEEIVGGSEDNAPVAQ
jgi:hypothetical protein